MYYSNCKQEIFLIFIQITYRVLQNLKSRDTNDISANEYDINAILSETQ